MNLRKIAGFAFALTLAAPVGLVLDSGNANAVTVFQKCNLLKGTATINPPLTTTPQNVTITASGSLTSCAPSAKTGGSGAIKSTIHQTGASCQGLAKGGTFKGPVTTTWKNGKTSKGTFVGTTTSAAPTTAKLSGSTTSGLFAPSKTSGSIMFTPKFTGSGPPCGPTNKLKTITFTSTYSGKPHPYSFHS